MRQMAEAFLDDFNTFIGIRIDGVSLSVSQCTKLDNKLLKAIEIQLLRLSFLEHLYIQVPHQVCHLVFVCKEEEFEIFEELDQLNGTQSFKSFLVVLEVVVAFDCVHAACVLEEESSEDFVVFLEKVLDVFDVSGFH